MKGLIRDRMRNPIKGKGEELIERSCIQELIKRRMIDLIIFSHIILGAYNPSRMFHTSDKLFQTLTV
jgi:hypothetical protein